MFFAYTIRGLIVRRASVLPTMLAIMVTVAAITIMQALIAGLAGTVAESGQPNNAVVLSAGADSDATSSVPVPAVAKIATLREVARVDNVEQLSAEVVVPKKFKTPDVHIHIVNLRGVDPIALKIHHAAIVQGQLPENHALGCVIGAQQLGRLPSFKLGGTIRIGKRDWPITGVLSAPQTQFESELWCDKTALMDEAKSSANSVVYVRLTGADAQQAFATDVRALGQSLDSFAEPVHFRRSVSSVDTYFDAMTIISLILAVGATLACVNAVYLAFLSRIRQLATLVAIGFTRWRIALITLQESLVMTVLAGLIGVGVAFLVVNGRSFGMEEISLVYRARMSLPVVLVGIGTTLAIGLLGAVASVIHSLRMRVLVGLRAL
jgi:putative ABC transport system permease protein